MNLQQFLFHKMNRTLDTKEVEEVTLTYAEKAKLKRDEEAHQLSLISEENG